MKQNDSKYLQQRCRKILQEKNLVHPIGTFNNPNRCIYIKYNKM